MPSIFTLSGPTLDRPSTHFPSRILSTTPSLRGALGAMSFSTAAANFWLGLAMGVGGYWGLNKYIIEPNRKKPRGGDMAGLGRCRPSRRRR